MGLVFSLVPRVPEAIKALQRAPQLLPRAWEGVYAPPLDGRAALAVLSDRWLEHRLELASLPAWDVPPMASPPAPRPYAAPPRRVMSAARADAPDEQPKSRFKWPWQK